MKLTIDKKHQYRVGKQKLIATTEFINLFFPKFDEKAVAKKLSHIPKYKAQKMGTRYWLKKWKFTREEGTKVHKEIEDFIKDNIPCKHPKAKSAEHYIRTELGECKIISEYKVFSELLGIAGTIDGFVMSEDNTISLLDWKTNEEITAKSYHNGILPPTEDLEDSKLLRYTLQLNVYKYLLENYYDTIVDNMYIVHIADGNWSKIMVPDKQDIVKEMLVYYLEHIKGKKV
jgi:ATP-dependent exoDNAse (exonuclease V) beta subunit